MFNIGAAELAVIFVVALLLLGPDKLPELARGIGKFMREFRRQTDEVRGMVEREFYQLDQDIKEEPTKAKNTVPSIKPPNEVPSLPDSSPQALADSPTQQPPDPMAPSAPKPVSPEPLLDPDGIGPDPTASSEPVSESTQVEEKARTEEKARI